MDYEKLIHNWNPFNAWNRKPSITLIAYGCLYILCYFILPVVLLAYNKKKKGLVIIFIEKVLISYNLIESKYKIQFFYFC